MKSPVDKSRISPREFIKKGWGKLMNKTRPPLIDSRGRKHEPNSDLVGEVFVYHPTNPTPFTDDNWVPNVQLKVETVKVLYIAQEKKVSLHFHMQKREIFYMVKGALKVTLISDGVEEVLNFMEGDTICINPGMVHQMEGVAEENILLEVSTKDETYDSYRIKKGD